MPYYALHRIRTCKSTMTTADCTNELTDVGNTDSSVFPVFFGRYSAFFGIYNTDVGIGIGVRDFPSIFFCGGLIDWLTRRDRPIACWRPDQKADIIDIRLDVCRGLTSDAALEDIFTGLALPCRGITPRAGCVPRAWDRYRAPTPLKLL